MQTLDSARVAIIGLGYVGLPLAVEFGKHFDTTGFDINRARIDELRAGRDSTLEVSPEELGAATRLGYTSDLQDLRGCNVYIVTVPTPIDAAKRPDLTPLVKASEAIGQVLGDGDVVIYESTVYPGCTEEVCVPILEKISGLKYASTSLLPPAGEGARRADEGTRHRGCDASPFRAPSPQPSPAGGRGSKGALTPALSRRRERGQ